MPEAELKPYQTHPKIIPTCRGSMSTLTVLNLMEIPLPYLYAMLMAKSAPCNAFLQKAKKGFSQRQAQKVVSGA